MGCPALETGLVQSVQRPFVSAAPVTFFLRLPPAGRPSGGYGTAASGTSRLVALASPFTSPSSTVTGTGGVSLKR